VILMRAPIKGRPKTSFDGEGEAERCTVTGILAEDGSELTYTSPPIGRIPVKNSPLWKGDPEQQLHYYSVRAWARRHFPDVILGVVERAEAQTIEAEANDVTPTAPPKPATLANKLDALAQEEEPELAREELEEAEEEGAEPEEKPVPASPSDPTHDPFHNRRDLGPAAQEPPEDVVPQAYGHLADAAAKGKRALRMALGKMSAQEIQAMPPELVPSLEKIAAYASMKQGD
jgi:hypothetical protein